MLDGDFKALALARGMLALEPGKAEEIVLAFIDDALIRGDHKRARMWQAVLGYIEALKPTTEH